MKTTVEKTERKGVTTPYQFTREEFWEEIRKAEEGQFYTLEQAEKMLEVWKKERKASTIKINI